MQSYQMPTYYGQPEHVYASYNDEFQNAAAGYVPTWELPPAPAPLVPCGNPMCTQESEALYCSAYCLEMCEGAMSEELDDTEDAPTITPGELETLLAALCAESPALREYLALSLMGPEQYCEAHAAYYRAQDTDTLLGRRALADRQYADDESRGGLAWLACYGR